MNIINRIYSQSVNNPFHLFVFFVVMNMIPSICLVFTEPLNLAGKFMLLLFPFACYCILFSAIKNIGLIQLILFPVLFLHAFQLVLFYLFGEGVIAVDMFLNLVTTNVSEATELLDGIWPAIILVIVLYIPTTIIAAIAFRHQVYTSFTFRIKTLLIGFASLVLAVGCSFFAKNINTKNFVANQEIYPLNVWYNVGYAVQKWQRINNYSETSAKFSFEATKLKHSKQREIYILVLGETSRAHNWSLYGYQRETNPLLSQNSNLICFQDAITQSNATHKSVPIMISPASAEDFDIIYKQKSIFSLFNEIGFTTIFLSNQAPNHSFTDLFANQANHFETLRPLTSSGTIAVNNYDDALLPLLENYIHTDTTNILLVLHTYGSHFNYSERYPDNFSRFTPDKVSKIRKDQREELINAYDNTILYTDHFLNEVIQILESEDCCSGMIYVSDHGEDILDDNRNRFLHASPSPTYYQLRIPYLIWLSDNYKAEFSEKAVAAKNNALLPISNNSVFHTLADMAAISSKYLIKERSLVSTDFKAKERMYLDNLDRPIPYTKANLKKQDKQMIEQQ